MKNISVIRAGSWGTTLANLLAKKGHQVTLWCYEKDLVERMTRNKTNDLYLDGISLEPQIIFTNDLPLSAQEKDLILLVPPSQVMRDVLFQLKPHLESSSLLVSASKGIENNTLKTMSEVLADVLGSNIAKRSAFLSGPSFAREVALEQPTAVSVASEDEGVSKRIQDIFSTDYFRVYTNRDVVGVEIGGALKNVIAVAAGVSDGLGFNHNARAALITRGLVEITRLGLAKGAQIGTFYGLAGMGDLVLTCTGDLSRNRTVGIELGRGRELKEILGQMRMVAEGIKTTLSAYQLAKQLQVNMPITDQMHQIIYQGKSPLEAVKDLMQRSLTSEDI